MIYIHTLGIQCNTILWLGCHVKWSDTLSFCLCVDQILNEHKHEHNISDILTSTQQKSNLNIIQLMISDRYFRPNRKLFQMKLGWKLICGAETIRARLFFYTPESMVVSFDSDHDHVNESRLHFWLQTRFCNIWFFLKGVKTLCPRFGGKTEK